MRKLLRSLAAPILLCLEFMVALVAPMTFLARSAVVVLAIATIALSFSWTMQLIEGRIASARVSLIRFTQSIARWKHKFVGGSAVFGYGGGGSGATRSSVRLALT